MSDTIRCFTDAMIDAGITTTRPIIGDGTLHRAHVEGDKPGTLNLAYILHLDGKPAGWWHYFKTGVTGNWSASGKKEPLTAAIRKQIDYAKEVRQQEQEKAHQEAKARARYIWDKAEPITEQSQHRYLVRKNIQPHGAKLYKGALALPLVDESGAPVNLQFIQPDGNKRFLKGGRKRGCFYQLGESSQKLLICEGFATGASLHQHTGHCVYVAFDAGNLEPVARAIRSQYPNNIIVICADGDSVGIEKATIAAFACDGLLIAPPGLIDFNDYVNAGGKIYG